MPAAFCVHSRRDTLVDEIRGVTLLDLEGNKATNCSRLLGRGIRLLAQQVYPTARNEVLAEEVVISLTLYDNGLRW